METTSQKQSVLLVATVSSFLTPFMGSATNVALPAIQSEFRLDAVILAWIPTLYLLSYAVFILPCSKIADIWGRKKVFMCGIWVFTISSALAAISPTTSVLLLSRVAQGMGSSMIFPTSLAILAAVFPPEERGKAIGISVAAVYIGLSTGPFIGGVPTNHLTWRAVFAAPIPVGIAAIYLSTWKLAGEWVVAPGEKIDLTGSILYGAAIWYSSCMGFQCYRRQKAFGPSVSARLLAGFSCGGSGKRLPPWSIWSSFVKTKSSLCPALPLS